MATKTTPRKRRGVPITLDRLNELATTEANRRFSATVRAEFRARPRRFTFVDLFSGAGGSSIGLWHAGGQLLGAFNHSQVAITTHAVNFHGSGAVHECADLDHYDMRNLPRGADVMWASVICTEISPAGGKKRNRKLNPAQLSLLEDGPVEDESWERTRATAHDVIRAAEVHRFPYIVVENVTEFAQDWRLFRWWLTGFEHLDYSWQLVNASSAHIGGPDNRPAPQWRDRIYIVFTRNGMAVPEVTPRPVGYCTPCGRDVETYQWFKDPKASAVEGILVGKYGPGHQYLYRCTTAGCGVVVEPYVLPASSILDWDNLGTRIGDRHLHKKKPLADATMRRIRRGLEMFGRPTLVNSAHDDDRAFPADLWPLPSRTTKIGDGLACPPMLIPSGGSWNAGRNGEGAALCDRPMRTRTTKDWEALFAPPPGAWIDVVRNHGVPKSVDRPVSTIAAGGNHHALVVPYRRANLPTPVSQPIGTISTVDSAGLMSVELDIEDCSYRMIQPREQARAQAIPDSYALLGTRGEQTMHAGNAVSSNVAQWIGDRIADALERS